MSVALFRISGRRGRRGGKRPVGSIICATVVDRIPTGVLLGTVAAVGPFNVFSCQELSSSVFERELFFVGVAGTVHTKELKYFIRARALVMSLSVSVQDGDM